MDARRELEEKDGSYIFCGMVFLTLAVSVMLAVLAREWPDRWGPIWVLNLLPILCAVTALFMVAYAAIKGLGMAPRSGVAPFTHLVIALNSLVMGIFFYQLFFKPLELHLMITLMIPVVMLGIDFVIYGAMNR